MLCQKCRALVIDLTVSLQSFQPFSFIHCLGIRCEQLADPANGRVGISGDNTPGSVATYSCNQGFRLEGVTVRSCDSDGTYGGEAPVCRGENMFVKMSQHFKHQVLTNGWLHLFYLRLRINNSISNSGYIIITYNTRSHIA